MMADDTVINTIKSKTYVDKSSVEAITKEHLDLQQEKLPLKYDFVCCERNYLFHQYLYKDRHTWPTVEDGAQKLSAGRKEKKKLKNQYEEVKEKICETLQLAHEEYEALQEKLIKAEEKIEVFKKKRARFEAHHHLDPSTAEAAIQKCQAAVERLESIVAGQRATLNSLDQALADLKVKLTGSTGATLPVSNMEGMVTRAKNIRTFLEEVQAIRVVSTSSNEIVIEMTKTPSGVLEKDDSFLLQVTMIFQTNCHGNTKLSDVKINIDHFNIKDVVDVAIATNDVPYLVMTLQDRWMNHFPLLSELDLLNKHHVIDWIQEQHQLRVLVGNCGRVMFTLQVPPDYPVSRGITLLDSYGLDSVDKDLLPSETASLLEWVIHLETSYGQLNSTGVEREKS